MGINITAALWGFAEATVFFIVPDVFLSAVSLRHLRAAVIACLYAAAGAVLGGALMYWWGTHDLPRALAVVQAVPAISPWMLERVHHQLEEKGVIALFIGPLSGTPYKIYALHAPGAGVGLETFLLTSGLARLPRFISVTLFSWWVSERFLSTVPLRRKEAILGVSWLIFYALYFSFMPR